MLKFLFSFISIVLLCAGILMLIEAVTPTDYAIAIFVVVMNIWNLTISIGGIFD